MQKKLQLNLEPLFVIPPANVALFKTLIDTLSSYSFEPKPCVFTPTGITFYSYESDYSTSFYFHLKPSFFTKFQTLDNTVIGISIEDLQTVFQRSMLSDTTIFLYYIQDHNKLVVKFTEDQTRHVVDYTIASRVVEGQEDQEIVTKLTKFDLDITLSLTKGKHRIKKLLRDIMIILEQKTPHLSIIYNHEQASLIFENSNEANTIHAHSVFLLSDYQDLFETVSYNNKENVIAKVICDLTVIKDILKLDHLESQINFAFSSDLLLRLTFNFESCVVKFIAGANEPEEEQV